MRLTDRVEYPNLVVEFVEFKERERSPGRESTRPGKVDASLESSVEQSSVRQWLPVDA
jgi:hypothetical protein